MLDLRLPTGAFFLIVGIILIFVSFTEPAAKTTLSDANVNLYSGLVMMGFGAFMLALAWRGRHSS